MLVKNLVTALHNGALAAAFKAIPNNKIMEATNTVANEQNNSINNEYPLGNPTYSPEEVAVLDSIEEEASAYYPVGKEFSSPQELRDSLRSFAHKKGFAVTTVGTTIFCTRCEEPQHQKNRREKKVKNDAPTTKTRTTTTTRCGCSFHISFSWKEWRNKQSNKAIKITKKTNYRHDNGCLPSRNQLAVEKRKAGCHTVAINEQRIKTILSVMESGTRVPIRLLRDLMRPLYPPGTSLDSQMIFNFRLKVKRLLASRPGDIDSQTITEEEEEALLSTNDLTEQSPEFLTEAFTQFNELLREALADQNDLLQIGNYLKALADKDPTFTFRIGHAEDGTTTGFIWQTGVMRRDFELNHEVLFVDRLGQPLNNKGWPCVTLAMVDADGKICLPSESIAIAENVDVYGWAIRSTVEMTPCVSLSDIKIIFSDGILAGESLLSMLGIEDSCKIVLDHHHLLSEDIGAWPKQFGLQLFARLKEDLTTMANTPHEHYYEAALERVRAKLQPHPHFLAYVEENIHGKRHLFANHIVKLYPGNQKLKGNAPAEANHSSIIQRLGRFVVSPVELVHDLMQRHHDICAERNHELITRHLKAQAESVTATTRSEKEAILGLASKGLSLFRQATKSAARLEMTTLQVVISCLL